MEKQNFFKRAARFILIVFASIWMLFEDWVWDRIRAGMAYVSRLKAINRLETFIAKQNPYLLLALFCVPFLIMIPAKLYGLFLIADGKVIRGISIFVLAKGLITALVTRLFIISKDKLLQIKAFALFYYWLKEKKEWLYAEVRKMRSWQAARAWIARLKAKIQALRAQMRSR
jgi:hypothetical protein